MKILEVADPMQQELPLRGGGMIEPIDAYHGTRSERIEGDFRPSERGRFGPGVYSSMVPGVASGYGTMHRVRVKANLFDAYPRFLPPDDLQWMRQKMFSLMTPEEQMHVAEWWPENKGMMSGEDVYEIMSRRLGHERTHEILQQMGYQGITGIGDGQEIVVFHPRHISLAEPSV